MTYDTSTLTIAYKNGERFNVEETNVVYVWFFHDEPAYVGYTTQPLHQRIYEHLMTKRKYKFANALRKRPDAFTCYLYKKCADEEECKREEVAAIDYFNTYCNSNPKGMNLTTGGEGTSGYVPTAKSRANARVKVMEFWTDERKAAHAEKLKGIYQDPTIREYIGSRVSASMTEELRQKHSDNFKKLWSTDEHKERMKKRKPARYWKGKQFSEEHRRKIGEASKGRKCKHTPESKKRLSLSRAKYVGENHPMYGRKHSDETRLRISEKIKAANERRAKEACIYSSIGRYNNFMTGDN